MTVEKPTFIEPVDHSDPEPDRAPTPDGSDVSRADAAPTEFSTPDVKAVEEEEDTRPKSYVWLANGQVKKCYDDDLPAHGTGDFGHWNEGNNVHLIVAVYPVEETVKG